MKKEKNKEKEMERVEGGGTKGGEGSSGRADLGTGYRPPETNTISWPIIIPLDDIFVSYLLCLFVLSYSFLLSCCITCRLFIS